MQSLIFPQPGMQPLPPGILTTGLPGNSHITSTLAQTHIKALCVLFFKEKLPKLCNENSEIFPLLLYCFVSLYSYFCCWTIRKLWILFFMCISSLTWVSGIGFPKAKNNLAHSATLRLLLHVTCQIAGRSSLCNLLLASKTSSAPSHPVPFKKSPNLSHT